MITKEWAQLVAVEKRLQRKVAIVLMYAFFQIFPTLLVRENCTRLAFYS